MAAPVVWLNIVREGTASLLFLVTAVAWATYTSAYRTSLVALVVGLAGVLSYLVVVDPEGWISTSIGLVVVWMAVRGLLRQQQLVEEQGRLLAELRAAQDELARAAGAAERRRIAREIHDVAAHTLAVTMLQLTGVRLLLQRTGGDPRAVEALGQAERLGRQGLDDVRRTVGLLDDDKAQENGPMPGGADIPLLLAQYRAAGLDLVVALDGDPAQLPAGVGLGLYRIVQEALANVAKHAPGARAELELRIDTAVHLRVRNGAPRAGMPLLGSSAGSGFGLRGMRERAELLGGSLNARPDGDGWLLECTLPCSAAGPAETPRMTGVA